MIKQKQVAENLDLKMIWIDSKVCGLKLNHQQQHPGLFNYVFVFHRK